MDKLNLKNVVPDTLTNAAGASLAVQLDKYLHDNIPVELSMSETVGISSSFFNSSFGQMFEKYGYDKIKSLIRITGVSPTQAQLLRSYFDSYRDFCAE